VDRATGDGASDVGRTGGIRTDGKSAAVPSASAQEPDVVDRTLPRGTDDWKLESPPAHHRIEAYSSLASGVPGVRVDLLVSTGAKRYRVFAYRIGAYAGGWGSLVWQSKVQRGRRQPDPILSPAATNTVVAPWKCDLEVDTTGWEPGFYVLKLVTGSGWDTLVPYVVSSPSARGTVALVAPATTWQAYNAWGGYSLYEGPAGDGRSLAVSFDRPYNRATGANDYRSAALPIVVRAEQLGVPLSYFTNIDLHERPDALDGARGYASMGHDEYWTPAMRRTVMTARDAGTNLAFFGANTMYWRVRLEGGATSGQRRLMIGYRDSAYLDPKRETSPAETTGRYRDAPVPRPENDLLGMQYECYPVDADYVVVSPGWWGFRGTGVRHGDRLPNLVGPEADRVYPDRRTPRPLEVLSNTAYDCRGTTTTSQSVYYTTPSGSGVFAAGTLRWGCAMIDHCDRPLGERPREFTRQVTANVLRQFTLGPVADRHPARDNLSHFDLPLANSVTAS
jgi:hypothetical protein